MILEHSGRCNFAIQTADFFHFIAHKALRLGLFWWMTELWDVPSNVFTPTARIDRKQFPLFQMTKWKIKSLQFFTSLWNHNRQLICMGDHSIFGPCSSQKLGLLIAHPPKKLSRDQIWIDNDSCHEVQFVWEWIYLINTNCKHLSRCSFTSHTTGLVSTLI